jgi:oxalate decarboxylase
MSDLTRRGFIGTVAVAAGAFAVPKTIDDDDLTFQNNVPNPLLSGKELPTFKFELEKSRSSRNLRVGLPQFSTLGLVRG